MIVLLAMNDSYNIIIFSAYMPSSTTRRASPMPSSTTRRASPDPENTPVIQKKLKKKPLGNDKLVYLKF